MIGARQTIAVTVNFRKCNKISLGRRAGAYRSSRKKSIIWSLDCWKGDRPVRPK